MPSRVGIIGIGYEGFRPVVSDLSVRELMFEAASKAYNDANIDPRKDVSSFISCDEDFWEGWSITDEMVPDQIGGARRAVSTVSADGLIGIAQAVMQISSGIGDIVVVEAHSKAADVISKDEVEMLSLEPSYVRPILSLDSLAALEMSYYMNGNDVSESDDLIKPLKKLDKAEYAEAAITIVLASESWIKKEKKDAVYIDGIAWSSSLPWYEAATIKSSYPEAVYMKDSFKKCCKDARVKEDLSSFDVIEVDDQYSYKLLQHLDALTNDTKQSEELAENMPHYLNPSSGSIAIGNLIEATSQARILEALIQLRGEAGAMQLKRVTRALVASWRGLSSPTGGAIILSR